MSAQPVFEIKEVAASGTFGTVCIAEDLATGELKALKVLKEHHAHRVRIIARTRDEAEMLRRIKHQGIVDVEGLIEIDGRPVVIMEWVRGLSLEDVLFDQATGVPPAVGVEIIALVAEALDAAYNAVPAPGEPPMRIIHRDIKPSNMLISIDGEVKVVDFGIARAEFAGKEAQTLSMVLGARGYLAPERLDGQDDTTSADVYSLGICLYELLTGRHVMLSVHRDYHDEAMEKHLAKWRPEAVSADVLPELHALFKGMCAYHPEDRLGHTEITRRARALVQSLGGPPDMAAWASEVVEPLFARRERTAALDHPDYPDLAVLERQKRRARRVPPAVDADIRRVLQTKEWWLAPDAIEGLMLRHPNWSPAPFLERLPSGQKAWWKFWGAEDVLPEEVRELLRFVLRNPTKEVRAKAVSLLDHPDTDVKRLASEIRALRPLRK